MKRDLLEQLIRKAIFEQNVDEVPVTKKIPIKISSLIGSDKSQYVAAGAIYGFDVERAVVKKQKGQRASESTMFAAINDVLKNTSVFKPIYDIVNREGLVALISGDFKPSARILSFRCWIFERNYWDAQIDLPYKQEFNYKTKPDEVIVYTKADLYIGRAVVKKFENGTWYAGQMLLDQSLNQLNVDVKGLKSYETWYNKLRKINKTLPTVEFQLTDISKLPPGYPDIPDAEDDTFYIEDVPQFTTTIDGEEFSLSEKLENAELQIQKHIRSTDKTTKTFLFSGDVIQSSTFVDYIGTATDAETANPVFVGSIRLIGKNSTTNELEYAFLDGTLTNYAMWKGDADSPTFQTYVITGEVKNGKIVDEAKIIDSQDTTRSSTWAKYLQSRKK
jgi:hypothetical protein